MALMVMACGPNESLAREFPSLVLRRKSKEMLPNIILRNSK